MSSVTANPDTTRVDDTPVAHKPAPQTQVSSRRAVMWLSVPAVVWYILFTIGPLIAMVVIAGLDWRGLIAQPSFVGTRNFVRMWADPTFWAAVRNTALQTVVVVPVMIPLYHPQLPGLLERVPVLAHDPWTRS